MCYNRHTVRKDGQAPRYANKGLKNFQKTFKKPLDKRNEMCYNNKVARKAGQRAGRLADH